MLFARSMGNILGVKQNIKPNYNSRALECYDLKILHLSDMHLPDWRIEKSASTDLNLGHEVVFGGMKSRYTGNVFSKVFQIHWTPRARRAVPFYWHSVKKQLEKVLNETKPAVIHAHNIFSAEMRISYHAKNVFVVPNFPMFSEVKDFEKPRFHNSLSSVYAGVEAKGEITPAHRNIDGFISSFLGKDIGDLVVIGWNAKSPSVRVRYMGFLPRQEMYREMFNHSIGLVPFKRHWSHVYISPNKAYEYPHAGLVVLSTSGFEPINAILREHCIAFEDYEDMASKLKYFKENMDELYKRRLRVFEFARENLIWEKNESSIIEAYRRCT